MRLDLSWQSTMHIFYMLLTNWLLSCLVWKPRLGRRIKPLSLIALNLAFTFIWYCADYLVSRQGYMQVWRGYNCSVSDKNFKTLHHFQAKSFSPCIWLITSTGMNELFSEFNPPTSRVSSLCSSLSSMLHIIWSCLVHSIPNSVTISFEVSPFYFSSNSGCLQGSTLNLSLGGREY